MRTLAVPATSRLHIICFANSFLSIGVQQYIMSRVILISRSQFKRCDAFKFSFAGIAIALLFLSVGCDQVFRTGSDMNRSSVSASIYLKSLRDRKVNTIIHRLLSSVFLQRISASDGSKGDYFGLNHELAVSNNFLVVGAYAHQNNSGAAYVYKKQNGEIGLYTEIAKLEAGDGMEDDAFGNVDISGEWISVGASWHPDKNNTGAVYMFRIMNTSGIQNKVIQQAKITAHDAKNNATFGGAVAIDGEVLVVGAHEISSVYIFRYISYENDWSEVTKLTFSEDSPYIDNEFGRSVDVSGDIVVVGAINANMAFIYNVSSKISGGWSQIAKLTPSDKRERFGYSVAISGDWIVVGCRENGTAAFDGIVSVYNNANGNWTEVAKLFPEYPTGKNHFGFSVSISTDASTIAVGSPVRDDQNAIAIVYVFQRGLSNQWTQIAMFETESGREMDDFGKSVALSENLVFVGAPGDYFDRGSVYVFNVNNSSEPGTPEGNVTQPPASSSLSSNQIIVIVVTVVLGVVISFIASVGFVFWYTKWKTQHQQQNEFLSDQPLQQGPAVNNAWVPAAPDPEPIDNTGAIVADAVYSVSITATPLARVAIVEDNNIPSGHDLEIETPAKVKSPMSEDSRDTKNDLEPAFKDQTRSFAN
jgi:hypothetical protein